jgi:hypothetical protein
MRYLCLIYSDDSQWPKMAKAEQDKWIAEYGAFTEGIKQSGHYVGSERLESAATASVVRHRNGRVSITDGPFVETKETLGGFFMITAKDLDEAIQIASRIPGARHGSVEVRPVMEMARQ